ncbi:MAG: VWA domain-containing protein [Verrucomicrobia bacterium]|nr:VWA domain-containing protein [Verrucomicrobiota bacterium]
MAKLAHQQVALCRHRGSWPARSLFAAGFAALLSLVPSAQGATLSADILWLVDTSGSMYEDNKLPAMRSRINRFNDAMVSHGIDARYGLVTFRGTESLQQDFVDFATFTSPTSPFSLLSHLEGGGAHPELGSDAILLGLNKASFRPDAVINLILFSDEDDQSSLEAFLAADRLLSDYSALFNAIVDPSFVHTSTGQGNVLERYGVLAANHEGALFDLSQFLAPETADAFFDSFTAAKVREIRSAASIPEPGGSLLVSFLILLTLVSRECSRAGLAAHGRRPPAP